VAKDRRPRYKIDPEDLPNDEERKALAAWDAEMAATKKAAHHFYPNVPIPIVKAVVDARAEVALPLVMAAHRRLTMRRLNMIPLTSSVWQAAGYADCSKRRRQTAIANLRKIPQVLELKEQRSLSARYHLSYGPLWKRKKHAPIDDEDEEY
jgi:hypothetical protein